eukprot:4316523-Pyramimonas_sp.AAC.1
MGRFLLLPFGASWQLRRPPGVHRGRPGRYFGESWPPTVKRAGGHKERKRACARGRLGPSGRPPRFD